MNQRNPSLSHSRAFISALAALCGMSVKDRKRAYAERDMRESGASKPDYAAAFTRRRSYRYTVNHDRLRRFKIKRAKLARRRNRGIMKSGHRRAA